MNTMAENHKATVKRVAKRFCRIYPNMDVRDVEVNMATKVESSADSYESGRGATFKSYAGRCMNWAIIDMIRREKKGWVPTAPNLTWRVDDTNTYSKLDNREEAEYLISLVPTPYAKILRQIYINGDNVPSIAREMGINRHKVYRLVQTGLGYIKSNVKNYSPHRKE